MDNKSNLLAEGEKNETNQILYNEREESAEYIESWRQKASIRIDKGMKKMDVVNIHVERDINQWESCIWHSVYKISRT